ncbi:MAG: FkbM family methyltransferase [Acidaminococcales bacterium]|jgi:FkbM family methyltransferase|nr:FkbM family methyltransferase [Acidaminococcales bacterium]
MSDIFAQKFEEIKSEIPNSKIASLLRKIKANIGLRPLVLYGAGQLGVAFLDACRELGLAVAAFCDRRAIDAVDGIPVIDADRLRREFSDALVMVCSQAYKDDIMNTLSGLGFPDERIIGCPIEFGNYLAVKGFVRYVSGYAWAYSFFSDESSKALVLDKIRLYLLDRPLKPNTKSACYYEEGVIALGTNEVFVDGGAYTGDTAEDFIKRNNVAGYHVYSFEPDPENYAKAAQDLAKYEHVTLTQKGLWSRETELLFTPNPENMAGSSFVIATDADQVRVPVTSLDAFFADKPQLPTFIKMDIEGAEKEALIGAANIIKKAKPKLAICAYHKIEDVYELPQTLLSIRDDYKFCLRQHKYGCWDTILYAV